MNPTRKRRLWLVLAVVTAAAIATTLIAMALQRNVAYLYTPHEVLGGSAGDNVRNGDARFRLRPLWLGRRMGPRLVILGHHYQRDEVIQFADITGDSFKLAQKAAANPGCEFIVFCGVSLGYADPSEPINSLMTERAALEEITELRGFAEEARGAEAAPTA